MGWLLDDWNREWTLVWGIIGHFAEMSLRLRYLENLLGDTAWIIARNLGNLKGR